MNKTSLRVFGLWALFVWALGRGWAFAEDVTVILSTNLKPYEETLAGLQESLGRPVRVLYLSDRKVSIPAGTQVIVAIGGDAALQNYPRDIALVYCLAPGVTLAPTDRKAPTVKVFMTPPAFTVVNKIKYLQPELTKLGTIALGNRQNDFISDFQDAGKRQHVEIFTERMDSPSELPEHLRALRPKIQALWIPPDPQLITRQNFEVIKEFCLSNRIAFYVPTVELVGQGATAAVSVSFRQMGSTAGGVVKQLMNNRLSDIRPYADKSLVAVSVPAGAAIGIQWTPDQIQKVDKIVP